MAQILELFALVEMTGPAHPKPHPAMNALAPQPLAPTIKQIVRTYENKSRADQDLELLSEIHRDGAYAVITVQHID